MRLISIRKHEKIRSHCIHIVKARILSLSKGQQFSSNRATIEF